MSIPDVVIVGAGSAGCALAARLSEDPARSVVLLEAGHDLGDAASRAQLTDASAMRGASPGHEANWALTAKLTADRSVVVPRGRVLGGSSTVNGGVFVRATPEDFDGWAALGNDRWSYAEVLPFLRRMEDDRDFADSPFHGSGGPVPVSRATDLHPFSAAFAESCRGLGFPTDADKNAPGSTGCGPIPRNVLDGVRVNAALAYVTPNQSRPNLRVISNAHVHRVVFAGKSAVAVDVEIDGTVQRITGGEIVLSAGAVMSAHLLLVSGIGPAEVLRRVSVQPVADLAGVGSRCRDHPQLFLQMRVDRELPVSEDVVQVGLDAVVDDVPVALMPYLASMSDLIPGSGAPSGERVIGMLLERSESAVEVRPMSSDPTVRPFIDHHVLDDATDRARLRQLAELALSIADSAPIRAVGLRRVGPGPGAELDDWIRDHVSTAVHLCSTAPMGPDTDPLAVVDQYCRVRGVDGLRVVDTSVLPSAPSRGPACTAVLIGERASAFF